MLVELQQFANAATELGGSLGSRQRATFNESENGENKRVCRHSTMLAYLRSEGKRDWGVVDSKIILYGILRGDVRPEGVEYHHDEMSDQRLFAEALRMLGDAESLDKMIEAYPNISLGDDKNKIKENPDEKKYARAA